MILNFDLYCFEKMLDEGLTMTYPSDKVVRYIRNKFNLTDDDIDIDYDDDFIMVHHDLKNNNIELFNKIKHILVSSGYYFGKIEEPAIIFEKKFEKDVFDELKSSGEITYLFHVSPSINDKKILKNGLIPKSKNYQFNYPDRIYLLGDKNVKNDPEFIKRICFELFKPILDKMSKENCDDEHIRKISKYSLFRIDFGKLNKINLYRDKNALNFESFFTMDNIHPNLIEKIDEIHIQV